ncbi:MAG TPA: TRAP transporter large permease subunit [Ramlibacter sp.]
MAAAPGALPNDRDWLRAAELWCERASQKLALAGVVAMLAIGILSALDVLVLRALFRSPVVGSNEFLSVSFGVALASVLAGGLSSRMTLEIDILSRWLSPRTVARLRAFGAGLFLLVICAVAWRVAISAHDAWRNQSITTLLQWKLWPFYWCIAVLFALCIPVQLFSFWRRARDLDFTDADGQPQEAGSMPAQPVWWRPLALLAAAGATLAVAWWVVTKHQPTIGAHPIAWAVALFLLLWVVAALFVPLAAALALCGILGAAGLLGGPQALSVLGSETVSLVTNEDLAVVPLFLMMGGFAVAGGLAQDMYRFAHSLFSPWRGGLAMATIGGCAGFGAVTGSSLATIATIGPAAYPEMKARGYSPELSTGSLVAGGTLGVLIPPSTVVVLYGLLTEQSIGTLYVALLVPALITVLFYFGTIVLTARRNPAAAPPGEPFDGKEALGAARRCIPAFAVFVAVFGGMFFGIFTATEAAAIGTVLTFVIALWRGKLSKGALWPVAVDTTRSTSMLYFVLIGALMVTFFMGTSGAPEALTELLGKSGFPALAIVLLIALLYIVLGTAMDTITIMMITAPILSGLMVTLGYSPIWWGIMTVMLVEIGVVSPPFGLNLFIMRTIAPEVRLEQVFRGVIPFLTADIVKVLLLILFPVVTLWLPSLSAIR